MAQRKKTGTAGDRLVNQLNESLDEGDEFDEREQALLDLARRQADDIEALEAALKTQGAMVTGSMGQERLNPIFGELRQQRTALARILGAVNFRDESDGTTSSKSVVRSRAAKRRYGGMKLVAD
jgi:hypothetical protein